MTTTTTNLAFICAMPMEVVPLVEKLGLTEQEINGVTVHTGALGDHDVVAIVTGMGTELAARASSGSSMRSESTG